MQDIPDKSTLLTAVARFLKRDLAPVTESPALRFRVLIAANLLGVVTREIGLEATHFNAEVDRLDGLLSEEAVAQLRAAQGEEARRAALSEAYAQLLTAPEVPEDALFAHVQATLAEKLAVINPRFDLSMTLDQEVS